MPQKSALKVLLIDDDEDDYFITNNCAKRIKAQQIDITWVSTYADAIKQIETDAFDVYLVDYRLSAQSGIDLIQDALKRGIRRPFILLTGQEEVATDINALQAGASDYLVKSKLDEYNLYRSITYAIERARATEALFEREQLYRQVFENTNDVIFIADCNMCIEQINISALSLLGRDQNTLVGQKIGTLFAQSIDGENFQTQLAENFEFPSTEVELIGSQNQKISCLLTSGVILDSAGKIKGYQGIIHDVTARKRAERDLLHTEKTAMTSRIARNIAHEVRNPLTNVMLSLEQLRSELPENEEHTMYLDIIGKNCKRINGLITELMESAKPASLDLQPINLNSALVDALSLAEDRMKLLGIGLVTNYQDNLPLVKADAEKLKIAFLNIMVNAIEAMPTTNASLEVGTKAVDNNKVAVTIKDNGIGIAKDAISKLFDAFYTAKPNGMGLGLVSVQNIVSTHKGSIDIESEEGKGTTFTLTFNAYAY